MVPSKGGAVNRKLAEVASRTGILMVTGSYSAALKGEAPESFDYRQEFPDLDLATNIGVDKSVDLGIKTVEAMNPVFYSSMLTLCRSSSCLRESVFSTLGRKMWRLMHRK